MSAGWIVSAAWFVAGLIASIFLGWWLHDLIDRKHMRDAMRETEAMMQMYGLGGRCHACGRKLPLPPLGE